MKDSHPGGPVEPVFHEPEAVYYSIDRGENESHQVRETIAALALAGFRRLAVSLESQGLAVEVPNTVANNLLCSGELAAGNPPNN